MESTRVSWPQPICKRQAATTSAGLPSLATDPGVRQSHSLFFLAVGVARTALTRAAFCGGACGTAKCWAPKRPDYRRGGDLIAEETCLEKLSTPNSGAIFPIHSERGVN